MSEKALTPREQVLKAVRENTSAMLKVNGKNKIFSAENIHELPSEAELAIGDPVLSQMAVGDIEAQIAQLEATKKALTAAHKPVKSEDEPRKAAKSDEAEAPAKEDKK